LEFIREVEKKYYDGIQMFGGGGDLDIIKVDTCNYPEIDDFLELQKLDFYVNTAKISLNLVIKQGEKFFTKTDTLYGVEDISEHYSDLKSIFLKHEIINSTKFYFEITYLEIYPSIIYFNKYLLKEKIFYLQSELKDKKCLLRTPLDFLFEFYATIDVKEE